MNKIILMSVILLFNITFTTGDKVSNINTFLTKQNLNNNIELIKETTANIPQSNIVLNTDNKNYYTDINLTSYAKKLDVQNDNENYFSFNRIDIVDNNGYEHQAVVVICDGSNDFTKPFNEFVENLKIAYSDDYGYIVGYLDLVRDNRIRTYSTMIIDFFKIQNVSITDKNDKVYNAVVIAIDGTEDFTKSYEELFSEFFTLYKSKK